VLLSSLLTTGLVLTAPDAGVAYEGPAECPERGAYVSKVESYVGAALADARVSVRISKPGDYALVLEFSVGDGPAVMETLEDPDCGVLRCGLPDQRSQQEGELRSGRCRRGPGQGRRAGDLHVELHLPGSEVPAPRPNGARLQGRVRHRTHRQSDLPVDADGVALASIQALYGQVQSLESENAKLRKTLSTLEKRLDALEKR
jgi:hypothetical protein